MKPIGLTEHLIRGRTSGFLEAHLKRWLFRKVLLGFVLLFLLFLTVSFKQVIISTSHHWGARGKAQLNPAKARGNLSSHYEQHNNVPPYIHIWKPKTWRMAPLSFMDVCDDRSNKINIQGLILNATTLTQPCVLWQVTHTKPDPRRPVPDGHGFKTPKRMRWWRWRKMDRAKGR